MVQKDKIVEVSQSDTESCPGGTEVGVVEVQSSVEEHSVVTERTGRRKFISGVVEGELAVLQSSVVYAHEMCFSQLTLSNNVLVALVT